MQLSKQIDIRLRAGALVVIVEEADELLAVQSAMAAAEIYRPLSVVAVSDPEIMEKVEGLKRGPSSTLIVTDFLRVFGGNPLAIRALREIALQQRGEDEAPSRLILIEAPGVEIPDVLRGDSEHVLSPVPDVSELKQELDEFILQNKLPPGSDEERHAMASAVAGLGRHEAARLFARCLVEQRELDAVFLRKEKAVRVADRLGGALTFIEPDVAGVGGLDGLRDWLRERRNAFGSEKAKAFGLPEPKGVLLLGPPGCGKSVTAKVVAKEWGLPLLRLDAGKLYGSLVGQSEAQTRQAIEAAEACSPCILWVDEIEKGLAGARGGNDSGTSQRVFGTLLTWLQEKTKPVFIVATANDVSALPPELLRKGRFDQIFFIDLPVERERTAIAEIHLSRRKVKKVAAKEIAKFTDGLNGAEIEQAIVDGLYRAFAEDRELKLADVREAVETTVPLSKTMAEVINALRLWSKNRAKPAARSEDQAAVGGDPSRVRRAVPIVRNETKKE